MTHWGPLRQIKKSVCVCLFVALRIQHATRMRHIVICSRALYTIFFHLISSTARFVLKKEAY